MGLIVDVRIHVRVVLVLVGRVVMDNPRQVDIGGIPGGEVIVGSRYLILVAFNEVVDDGHAGFARLVVLVVFVVVGGVDDLVTDVAAHYFFLLATVKGAVRMVMPNKTRAGSKRDMILLW